MDYQTAKDLVKEALDLMATEGSEFYSSYKFITESDLVKTAPPDEFSAQPVFVQLKPYLYELLLPYPQSTSVENACKFILTFFTLIFAFDKLAAKGLVFTGSQTGTKFKITRAAINKHWLTGQITPQSAECTNVLVFYNDSKSKHASIGVRLADNIDLNSLGNYIDAPLVATCWGAGSIYNKDTSTGPVEHCTIRNIVDMIKKFLK